MIHVRHIMHWLSKRIKLVFALGLLSLVVIFVWFLFVDNSSTEILAIRIASISALFAAISSIATLIQAVESQKQRQGLERPYIVADFYVASDGEINFVTQNIGNSPAVNVTVKFLDPQPKDFANRPLGFSDPIRFLPPNKSVRQLMEFGHTLFLKNKPTKFNFIVSYTSVFHELYEEKIEQDLSYLKGVSYPEKSIQEGLEKISNQIANLASQSSSIRGIGEPPSSEYSLNSIAKELREINRKLSPNTSSSLIEKITNLLRKITNG